MPKVIQFFSMSITVKFQSFFFGLLVIYTFYKITIHYLMIDLLKIFIDKICYRTNETKDNRRPSTHHRCCHGLQNKRYASERKVAGRDDIASNK